MLRTLPSYFLRTLCEDPTDAEVDSHKLLVRVSYIRRAALGIYAWLLLGLRVLRKVEAIVREEMDRMGAQEVHFLVPLSAEPYKATKRWEEYSPVPFTLVDRKQGDYLLAPTHEGMLTPFVKDMHPSCKDPPTILYQIQMKYRGEVRPRTGLIRGREFIMRDAYPFDLTDERLNAFYNAERDTYERISTRLGLDYVIMSVMLGAMEGSRSEEFLHPNSIGENTFVCSPGSCVANAEAVTTPAPEPIDASEVGEPRVVATSECSTIEAPVELPNSEYPRSDGHPWSGADTLKNVVVTLTYPDGTSELLVVGIPGDRQIDTKRLGALLAPAEAEMATDKESEDHPEPVRGYIGSQVIGPNSSARTIGEDRCVSGSARYLVDPRIVEGASWVAGVNKDQHHVSDLIMGRDFQVDGTIKAAEVYEGDLAPDGSGPLYLERGIEIGHVLALGRKYAKVLGLMVLDENDRVQVVTMGSYGIGASRVLAALAEANHNDKGLAQPATIAPFDVHVLATGKGNEVFKTAQVLFQELGTRGLDVLFDDRRKASAGVKFADSELPGVPLSLVVGRGLATGLVEARERASGERGKFAIEEAVEILVVAHEQLIKGE